MTSSPPIIEFRGRNWFLSNFYPSKIRMNEKWYQTVEHAFQASKTRNLEERKYVRNAPTAAKAKQRGYKVTLREDWEEVKESVMLRLLRQKFQIPSLKKKLLETDGRRLVEGNTWLDTYWGQCPIGEGKNRLGVLLMKVRSELRGGRG